MNGKELESINVRIKCEKKENKHKETSSEYGDK